MKKICLYLLHIGLSSSGLCTLKGSGQIQADWCSMGGLRSDQGAISHSVSKHNSSIVKNIDQKLPNKLHGPMHYEIGVSGVFN